MPTQHVEPDSHALLQDVANSLLKARKVVVVTGAGISTNSGIPDFRSENGLYSLIQAQFDAANQPTRPAERSKADGANDIGEEPCSTKRGMTSREASPDLDEVTRQLKEDIEARAESDIPAAPSRAAGTQPTVAASDANALEGVCLSTPRHKPALPSTPQPTTSPLSSPPREDFLIPLPSWSSSSILRTEDRKRIADASHNVVSSPLSSPPPVLFDPFHPSSPSDESRSRRSSTTPSEAEENPPNAMPASQTSSFGKATLPNMKGKDLFDASIWSDPTRTSVFYQFATSLRQKVREAEPTSSHKFISHLRDRGKLVRCYTQNIDQIEEKVGLSTSLEDGPGSRGRFSRKATSNASQLNKMVQEVSSGEGGASSHVNASSQSSNGSSEQSSAETSQSNDKTEEEDSAGSGSSTTTPPDRPKPAPRKEPPQSGVECVFLHGSLQLLRCFLCGQVCSWDDDDREVETLSGMQPECPHCVGATEARQERGKRALGVGKLRPDIVLYGEEHPSAHLISPIVTHDLGLYPDMLLILGTSLRVHGLKVLVREFAKTVHSRGGKVVFVNFTKPPESSWGDIIDYWIQWDCDAWVSDLQVRIPKLWQDPEPPKPKKKRDSGGAADDSREEKKRPPAQNPVALRDTKVNGAYCTLKILKELRRITHTSPPPPSSLSLALALAGAPPSSSLPVTQPPLSRSSAAVAHPKITAPEPPTTTEAVPRAAIMDPSRISTPRGKAKRPRRSASGALERPQRTPSTLNPNHGRSKKPAAEPPEEQPQEVPETPSQPPASTVEDFSSILHSVKSNPRIRKRKMIDGEEFVFPAVGKKRGAVDSLYRGPGDDTKELPPLRPMPEPISPSPVAALPVEEEGSVEEPLASISVNVRAATTFARPEAFYIQDPLVTLLEKAPQWKTLEAKQGEAKRSKRRVSKRFLPMQMETKAQAEANAALALAGLKTNSPMMAEVAHSVSGGGGLPELASWAATWSCKK
ncbi:SIR2 superfamily [Trichoderma longibrachiatum]